ncbi:hypothetical protein [Chitinophaga ginsengisoli]|uniref:Uncharacterized protein n=1 Tax=Chitinophaga ginsengisoli TaxID=363837 RepID=A0A2P8GD44_9BACT|nr:hypothetical protein [Chitinophaga ginsengisoli]PSL31901.1 hypothetical protein CLV42_104199 [Chitinophaga ginsengisoli]
MRTRRPFKFFQLFAFLFIITGILPASAQQFTWQAGLPAISETGFYTISLHPEFIAKSDDTALTDVRLFERETAVSYILRHDTPYITLPSPVITTRNDAAHRRTVIQLQFKEEYLIEQLKLTVATPAYFKRYIYITKDTSSMTPGQEFALVSGQPAAFKLYTPLKTRQCFIIIKNEDNPALQVKDISARQQHIYLTAWLEKGKSYLLKTGVPDLPAPVYDLPYFANKLPERIPMLEAGNITPIPAVIKNMPSPAAETHSSVFTSKKWIWVGICSIIVLIALLSIRLLRDMRERK